jgi:hypothetical protein
LVTVAPADTANILDKKLKLSITSVVVALAGTDSLVAGSLPRIVLRRAKATNRANARVRIFRFLRNEASTETFSTALLLQKPETP